MNSGTGRIIRRVDRAHLSHLEVVERAEALYRSNLGTPTSVSTLSRVVGLSERGLRNAFYEVRGMSPKRCMLRERLHGARRALRTRKARTTTVTSVATDYGFYELGRFACAYKQLFGEVPSNTLRVASKSAWMNSEHERNA